MGALSNERTHPTSAGSLEAAERLHRRLSVALQVLLTLGFVAALYERQWLPAFTTLGITLLTALPLDHSTGGVSQ
jgi:hypothetical protein